MEVSKHDDLALPLGWPLRSARGYHRHCAWQTIIYQQHQQHQQFSQQPHRLPPRCSNVANVVVADLLGKNDLRVEIGSLFAKTLLGQPYLALNVRGWFICNSRRNGARFKP
jgi:hypothetical protein